MSQSSENAAVGVVSRRTIVLLFFLSGGSGLAYEIVWSRTLSLIFGATTLGISTVLAAFMAGLALGGVWLGRVADRQRDPIRLYGLLEAGVGMYALVVPAVFRAVEAAYVAYYRAAEPSFWVLSLYRFLLCFIAILAPTTLMGGTLPALSRAVSGDKRSIGRGVGGLYAVNTFGAVLGAFATGFLFLPWAGVQITTALAAAVNLSIAAVVLYGLSGRVLPAEQRASAAGEQRMPAVDSALPPGRGLVMLAVGISGFCAFWYEVAWTRTLTFSFGGSVYAFTTMLVGFLLGIAIGSALASIVSDRLKSPLCGLGLVQLGIAICVVLATPLLGSLPEYVLKGFRYLGTGFLSFQAVQFALCMAVMLVPAALMGATFPIAVKAFEPESAEVGASVGTLYASNTLGTILGSFTAGFVLLPTIGPQNTIIAGAFVNAVLGLALVLASRQKRAAVWVLCGAAACVATAWAMPPWSRELLASGVYVYGPTILRGPSVSTGARDLVKDAKLLYYRDGLTCTVAVLQGDKRRAYVRSLALNGKVDASDSDWDMMTQRLLAHIPLLLAERLRSVLVIGVGSGCTAGTALLYPARAIDVVEIEPAVVEASQRFFSHINRRYWEDPRVRIIVGDGRNYVMMTTAKYDCIISEPSNPWISGASNLFTIDHYRRVKERLAPGGIFCQWMPAYYMSPEDFRIAVRTLHAVFPNVTLWVSPPIYNDILLVATEKPLRPDPELLLRRMSVPTIRDDLVDMQIAGPWGLLSLCLMSGDDVAEYCSDGPIHSDDRPVLEYLSPRRVRMDVGEQTVEGLWRFRSEASLPLTPAVGYSAGRTKAQWFGALLDLPGRWEVVTSDLLSVREVGPTRGGVYDVRVARRARLGLKGRDVELTLMAAQTSKPEAWADQLRKVAGELGRPIEGLTISGHQARGLWASEMGTAVSALVWHCRGAAMQYMLSAVWPHPMDARKVIQAWKRITAGVHCPLQTAPTRNARS
ncbi:MAG: fused MFS/spermidine synthase [Armatimonadota bacterium]